MTTPGERTAILPEFSRIDFEWRRPGHRLIALPAVPTIKPLEILYQAQGTDPKHDVPGRPGDFLKILRLRTLKSQSFGFRDS